MTEQIQENQINPQVVEQVPVIVQEKKKSNTKLFIIISLIAISLITVGVYAGIQISKKQTTPPIVSQPTVFPTIVQPTAVPTIVPDETANWKIYTNDQYGFEFKYPLDYKVTASPVTGDQFNIIVNQKANTSEAGFVPIQLSINMTTDENGNPLVISSVKEAEAYFVKRFSSGSVIRKNIIVANKSAISITGLLAGPGPGEGNFLHYTLVQLNNEVLVIQLGNQGYQSIFDQILSTFKFLD